MNNTSVAWTFGKNARPYQRAQRYQAKQAAPGPGAYEIRGKNTLVGSAQPSFSIGTGKRTGGGSGPVKGMVIVPGPGQYEYEAAGQAVASNAKTIGKKLKGMLESKIGDNVPGPGHYTYT